MAWIDKLRSPHDDDIPFGLRLSLAHQKAADPLLAALTHWLDTNHHRFVPADMLGDKFVLRGPPPTAGLQPRRKRAGYWDNPADLAPGAAQGEPGCNAGFVVWDAGVRVGHFVWPVVFDREVVPHGWTPQKARQHLLKHGHLRPGSGANITTPLPHALSVHAAPGQPCEEFVTHSRGGLKYKTPIKVIRVPQPRVLAVRGLLRAQDSREIGRACEAGVFT